MIIYGYNKGGITEVQQLLEAVADREVPGALVTAITAETNGNPFFIREVLLHLVEDGKIFHHEGQWVADCTVEQMGIPHTVLQVIQHRLARLSEVANRLLRAAAGFTGSFRLDLATRVAELDDADALDAIDDALEAQLPRTASRAESFDFTHALVRHTLYAELSPPRQERLHRQIAEVMEQASGHGTTENAGEIAQHYHRSATLPGAERGVPLALLAADQAERSAAFVAASSYLRTALALLPQNDARRPRLLARLALTLAGSLHWTRR